VFRYFTLGILKSVCFPDKILTLLLLLFLEQAETPGVYSFRVLPWRETWKYLWLWRYSTCCGLPGYETV